MFSCLALLAGVVGLHSERANRERRDRMMSTPASTIAQALGDDRVEIRGRIVPSEHGVFTAPFSNQQVVWVRVTVKRWQDHKNGGFFVTLLQMSDARPFLLDDGSGQRARILPDRAHTNIDEARSRKFNSVTPLFESFLKAQQEDGETFRLNKTVQYTEEVLLPGEELLAVGASRREPGPPVNDGYRMSSTSQLVLFHGGETVDELVLSNEPQEHFISTLEAGSAGHKVWLVLGVLTLLVSVVGGLTTIFK
jgi:hypothetical protein